MGARAGQGEGIEMLLLGDLVPDFTAESTVGRINLYDWLGEGWGILFSHPKDFTPVCTTELGEVARLKPEFDRRDTKVLGLSVDTAESHSAWAGDIADASGSELNFPLIADPDHRLADLYGMIHPRELETLTVRSLFVIDPKKRLRLSITYPAAVGRNFAEILRVLDALQLVDRFPVSTPANWSPGGEVIVAGSLGDSEAQERFPAGVRTVKPYLRFTPDPG